MKKLIVLFSLLCLVSQPRAAHADEPMIKIAVGEARVKKSRVAFPSVFNGKGSADPNGYLREIRDVTTEDLAFSGLFEFIDPAAFIENAATAGATPGTFKFTDWSTVNAQFLIKGQGQVVGKDITMEIYLYSVSSSKTLLSKRYSARAESLRKLAHSVSNDVFHALTGMRGPFTSKVAFVSDVSGKKEIYLMDYDGHNRVQVTTRRSITMSPSWSPDGKSLLFSSVASDSKNVKNHNLYLYNLSTGRVELLSNKKGINSGAQFSPDAREIILTMSFLGNPEIFAMDPSSKVAKKITSNYGMDVDPSYSPDGKHITFVSDRSGRPMIYKMRNDGSDITRLTYAGYYNATPSWSPTGNKITFAGWDNNKFDIFIMNTDGSNIERLTKEMGNNEDPHFAPDGYFIVYSSNRQGKKNLYITNIDNTVHRQITANFGNCEAPKWGPAL